MSKHAREPWSGMTPHTPTPWTCRKAVDGSKTFMIEHAKDGHIAEVVTRQDARLITAAPNMLWALKVAREWLSDDDPNWEPRKVVDAAIAEAEGK